MQWSLLLWENHDSRKAKHSWSTEAREAGSKQNPGRQGSPVAFSGRNKWCPTMTEPRSYSGKLAQAISQIIFQMGTKVEARGPVKILLQ